MYFNTGCFKLHLYTQARAIISDDFVGANDLNGGNPVDDISGGQATTQVKPWTLVMLNYQ